MKRGTIVAINEDPAWSENSEWGPDHVAYHWRKVLEFDLPGVVGRVEGNPAVCVERFDQVTPDEQHMVVGDYMFTLDFEQAFTMLTSPDDLDRFANAFQEAANKLRTFMAAEGITELVTKRP
jgi:hypothetical protein